MYTLQEFPKYVISRGPHDLKSNRMNCVNRPFWQIDLANQPNSYPESHDLHSSLKKAISNLVPLLTADSWASPAIKKNYDLMSQSLAKITIRGLQFLLNSDLWGDKVDSQQWLICD